MSQYYTIKHQIFHLIVLILALILVDAFFNVGVVGNTKKVNLGKKEVLSVNMQKEAHWLMLHRKSNVEYLYFGVPGDAANSEFIREFRVKTGVPGQKPTPLPELLGREYFVIMAKMNSSWDSETAPYFLTLDVPITDRPPYGPADYPECASGCDWELPGYFGLHGVNGDKTRLSDEDAGSSGCIRHSDEDIIYLYNLLDPTREEIRYYIKDI